MNVSAEGKGIYEQEDYCVRGWYLQYPSWG